MYYGISHRKIKPIYFRCLAAAFGSSLISSIYSVVDMAMVGQYHGPEETAALAVAAPLPDSDEIIAAYGVVQRLILIGCYVVMGFMQGYQPVASYAFGAKKEERFHESVRFALKGSLLLTVLVAAVYILLSGPLILLFNRNPLIVQYGRNLLISQVALYPAFGLCYMMTITFQTIGASRYGLFLSMIRQGLFYVPFILVLPKLLGVAGIYFSQPAADVLTILVCVFSIQSMKRIASKNMAAAPGTEQPQ